MKFHSGEIAVQTRAGVRDTAEDVGDGIQDTIPEAAEGFLAPRRMIVIGSPDERGRVWASVLTGEPGFLSIIDERTVRIAALPIEGDPLREGLATEKPIALFIPDFTAARRIRLNGRGRIIDDGIQVHSEQFYGNCRRYMQERLIAGERPSAGMEQPRASRAGKLSQGDREQIQLSDTFFIATQHSDAGADVSHKGGKPGFVRVIDDGRLAYPDYNGNSMFNTLGNLTINPSAGLLFIDFDSGRTVQITGNASIDWNPERAKEFTGAERVVDFAIDEVIANDRGFPLLAKFRQYSRFNP